jgi:hypothetical protein
MRVFEFYFNPKLKNDLVFESFCYEPENIYEKRVGSLYMVGAIKNALPKSQRLLDELARTVKDRYYTPILKSPEKTFKESLKRANNFLEALVQRGDVSWLGNLNFATLAIQKNSFNLSKVGNIKTFLIRKKKITDIEKKIKFEDMEPYPLKVFLNIVSGKLTEDDVMVLLSNEVAEFFEKESILDELTKLYPLDEKNITEFFNSKKIKFKDLSGVCLLIVFKDEKQKNRKRNILVQPKTQEFSFKQALSPLLKIKLPKLDNIKDKIKLMLQGISKKSVKKDVQEKKRQPEKRKNSKSKRVNKIKIPKISIQDFKLPKINFRYLEKRIKVFLQRKNAVLTVGLIIFLIIGFTIFQKETSQQLSIYQEQLDQIQEQIDSANEMIILNNSESNQEAQEILQRSWEELDSITEIYLTLPESFQNEVDSLKSEILNNLSGMNKLEIINNPEVIFNFQNEEFIPNKIILNNENIYFSSTESKGIFKLDQDNEGQLIELNQFFLSGTNWDDSIVLFSKPNKILIYKEGQLNQSFYLEEPYNDFDFIDFTVFNSNLYFLEKNRNEIIKYPYIGDYKWDLPQVWISEESKKMNNTSSLTVDGSVWILNGKDITEYSLGEFEKTLDLSVFPVIDKPSKILASQVLPYLYVLEPSQNRLIVLNKNGETIKQFQSSEFDNLIDFSVSDNGSSIWLLNDLSVFKINF